MAAPLQEELDHELNAPITVPQPQYDPYFTANEKIIHDLLLDEKRYHSSPGYCVKQPLTVAKWMRRALLTWLRDAKELTICLTLQWDLSCITPVDFIAPVVEFLEFVPSLKNIIRQAALNIYVKTFHVEELCMYLPSYMAAACILYALNLTVHPDLSEVALRSVTRVQQLLRLEARKIREVYQQLQMCFEPGTVQLSEAVLTADKGPTSNAPEPVNHAAVQPNGNYNCTSNASNQTLLVPLATSTQLQPRRSNGTSSASNSLSSIGSGSAGGTSFDRVMHPTPGSVSTSSPSTEMDANYLNDTENEQPNLVAVRRSMPYPHSQHVRYYHHQQPQQPLHPNVHAAGQSLMHEQQHNHHLSSIANNNICWGGGDSVTNLVGQVPTTVDLLAMKATVCPSDPRLLILAANATTGLVTQCGTQRRWTPTDVREVQLE